LVCCTKKNLATLRRTKSTDQAGCFLNQCKTFLGGPVRQSFYKPPRQQEAGQRRFVASAPPRRAFVGEANFECCPNWSVLPAAARLWCLPKHRAHKQIHAS
jgi:hypothetical protein